MPLHGDHACGTKPLLLEAVALRQPAYRRRCWVRLRGVYAITEEFARKGEAMFRCTRKCFEGVTATSARLAGDGRLSPASKSVYKSYLLPSRHRPPYLVKKNNNNGLTHWTRTYIQIKTSY